MGFHIANYYDAPRYSARAGETMTIGMVVKVSLFGTGERKLMKLLDADSAELVAGKYGVVAKVSGEPNLVDTSTAPARLGSRVISIASGDHVVEVRRGAIMEYTADLLHASLNPGSGGATPAVGDALGIKDSLWCTAATGGAITSPVAGRVFRTFGTRVLVELV